jgi:hypothetical protein
MYTKKYRHFKKERRGWYNGSYLIQATQEAENGGSQFEASPGKKLVKSHFNQ